MVQEAGGGVENCLGKVKGTEQKGKLNMGKYMVFPLGFVFILIAC